LQILDLRDCKRSVKKDILDECRAGWEEPEASDDEATYSLVMSGVDMNQIPSGSEKFSLFSECTISGNWPDWKERRDRDRKNRIASLKARKELAAQQLKERELQVDEERRQASLAAHQKALENAKKIASEKARDDARNHNAPTAKSGCASSNDEGSNIAVPASPSAGSRISIDMSLSQIRALQKTMAEQKSSAAVEKIEENAAGAAKSATINSGAQPNLPAYPNGNDAAVQSQLNASISGTVKETMKEKIARQKREAELAAASGTPPLAKDAFRNAVQEVVQASIEEGKGSGKETIKEKIARQKREAELAASEGSGASPSTPTSAFMDADASMRSRSDSSTGKETLKEKIARQKREAELITATSSPSPTTLSLSVDADEFRSGMGKETLKEKLARQKLESEMASMSTSEISLPSLESATSSEQQAKVAESSSGKETIKEKIARQKREAELAASEGSGASPSTPTSASMDADASMRSRSDSSAGKETLKEKIARAKREAELAASSASAGTDDFSNGVVFDPVGLESPPSRLSSSTSKETLKERIARQKLETDTAAGTKTSNTDSDAATPRQPVVATTIIGGLGARRGSAAFIRSIQRSPGQGSDMRNA
jgi:hypothetical protein